MAVSDPNMEGNVPIGVFVRVGMPQNGKQEYRMAQPNINGGIDTFSIKVDEKNADKFDRLNVDCMIAGSEANRKIAKGSFIGSIIGGLIGLATPIAIAKTKWVGALIGIVTGIVGAIGGMMCGSYVSAKNAIPQAKQRIEQNEQQMAMLIEQNSNVEIKQ